MLQSGEKVDLAYNFRVLIVGGDIIRLDQQKLIY